MKNHKEKIGLGISLGLMMLLLSGCTNNEVQEWVTDLSTPAPISQATMSPQRPPEMQATYTSGTLSGSKVSFILYQSGELLLENGELLSKLTDEPEISKNLDKITKITFGSGLTVIGTNVCSGLEKVKEVRILGDTQLIGERAFSDCKALAEVTIGENVTEIGSNAFSGCTALRHIDLKGNVQKIGDYAFARCTSLESVNIGQSVTSVGASVFSGCSALIYASIGTDYNAHAFEGCTALETVNLEDTVTQIGDYTFKNCEKLKRVTFSSGLKSIGKEAFSGCSSLPEVEIPGTVVSIGNSAFLECKGLSSVAFDDGEDITVGNNVFSGCKALVDIRFPETSRISLGSSVFSGCDTLENIEIPAVVTRIGNYAFQDCKKLTHVIIAGTETVVGVKLFDGCSVLKSVEFGCTTIGENVLTGNDTIQEVRFRSSVRTIGKSAFAFCSRLEVADFETEEVDGQTVGVIDIGELAFENCTSLKKISIPRSVTHIGFGFIQGCDKGVLKGATYAGKASQWKKIKTESSLGGKETTFYVSDDSGSKVEVPYNGVYYSITCKK